MLMRKIFSLTMAVALAALALTGCNKQQRYHITTQGIALHDGDSIALYDMLGDNQLLLTTTVKDGKIDFEGTSPEPTFAMLTRIAPPPTSADDYFGAIVFLENGDIVLTNKPAKNAMGELDTLTFANGTPLNDDWTDISMKELSDEENNKAYTALIGKHKDDVLGLFCLLGNMGNFTPEQMDSLATLLEPTWKDNGYFKEFKDVTIGKAAEKAALIGTKFIDFEAEYNGKTQKLSDYVGKGNYALVDFWASWCGPCRQEIPNIKKAYETYKDKGLVVLGVASWDDPEATLKAIEEEGVAYPQIINAQDAGTKAYGIEGIPEIMLFGPDGTILATGLRGENIDAKLKEIYAN